MAKKDTFATLGALVHAIGCPQHGLLAATMKLSALAGSSLPFLHSANTLHEGIVHGVETAIYHYSLYDLHILPEQEFIHETTHHGVDALGWIGLGYTAYAWGPKVVRKGTEVIKRGYERIRT